MVGVVYLEATYVNLVMARRQNHSLRANHNSNANTTKRLASVIAGLIINGGCICSIRNLRHRNRDNRQHNRCCRRNGCCENRSNRNNISDK